MVKDKKFIDNLDSKLKDLDEKDRTFIVSKYKKLIKDELAKKRKINDIMKEIGSADSVAKKEIALLEERKKKKNVFAKFYNAITKDLTNKNTDNKEKKKEKKEDKKIEKEEKNVKKRLDKEKKNKTKQKEKSKKNTDKKEFNLLGFFKKKDNSKDNKKIKNVKVVGKLKKEPKKRKDFNILGKFKKDNKRKDFNILGKFKKDNKRKDFNILGKFKKDNKRKDIKIFGKFKKENKVEKPIEEVEDFIGDVSDEISETHIFETKEQKRKRFVFSIIKIFIVCAMLFAFLWISIITIASIFAYLDGVKFIGMVIAGVSINLLWLWIMIMLFRFIYNKKNNIKLNIIVSGVLIFLLAAGIVLFVKKLYSIESREDVSDKYSMTSKYDTYILPSDTNKHLSIVFNANYDTQYIIEYDENMLGKVKVDVKYYEAYYDYYIKKSSNQVYISLKVDERDRLSTYINDLKDGLIYDKDELSRYIVKIIMSKEDAGRVDIIDDKYIHN